MRKNNVLECRTTLIKEEEVVDSLSFLICVLVSRKVDPGRRIHPDST